MGKKPLVGKRQRGHIKRRMAARDPKMIEVSKKVLLLRGNKSGEYGMEFLRDIRRLKGADDAVMFTRKNDVLPFEDEARMEFFSEKNDCGIFMMTSHSKKRPNNLVIGRLYDNHLLDMLELEMSNYVSFMDLMRKTKVTKMLGSQTAVLFQGDEFESSENMQTFRSILLDVFRAPTKQLVDLAAIDHLVVCSAVNGMVYVRNYVVVYKGKEKSKHVATDKVMGQRIPDLGLVDMGPSIDLKIRRARLPSPELMKLALRQPRTANKAKKVKNITHDELQGKLGTIHMKRQDMNKLVTRSRFKRALKRGKGPGASSSSKE